MSKPHTERRHLFKPDTVRPFPLCGATVDSSICGRPERAEVHHVVGSYEGEGDLARAIGDAEYGRRTHQQWLDYLEHPHRDTNDGVVIEDIGSAEHQREWIARYDNILACLRGAGEGEAATNAIRDLFALMAQDSKGEWCFNSLSGDWQQLQSVLKRLARAATPSSPAPQGAFNHAAEICAELGGKP